jgi:hypothetical protein
MLLARRGDVAGFDTRPVASDLLPEAFPDRLAAFYKGLKETRFV